jgi:ABC-2 type transport system ATP-binding protein
MDTLSFRYAYDEAEIRKAFYAESSLRGSVIVTENTDGEEGKMDLELLYKAIIANGATIQNLFKAKHTV